jgi:hypothetical protein
MTYYQRGNRQSKQEMESFQQGNAKLAALI